MDDDAQSKRSSKREQNDHVAKILSRSVVCARFDPETVGAAAVVDDATADRERRQPWSAERLRFVGKMMRSLR